MKIVREILCSSLKKRNMQGVLANKILIQLSVIQANRLTWFLMNRIYKTLLLLSTRS